MAQSTLPAHSRTSEFSANDRPHGEERRAAARLEPWGRLILRDAALRAAPQDEAKEPQSKTLSIDRTVPHQRPIQIRDRKYDQRNQKQPEAAPSVEHYRNQYCCQPQGAQDERTILSNPDCNTPRHPGQQQTNWRKSGQQPNNKSKFKQANNAYSNPKSRKAEVEFIDCRHAASFFFAGAKRP